MDDSSTPSITPDPVTPISKPQQIVSPPPSSKLGKPYSLQTVIVQVLLVAFMLIAGYLVNQITGVKNDVDNKNQALDKRLVVLEKPSKYVQEQVDKTKFQAVFLEGGQVYFGKISHIDQDTMTMNDIYYLKTGSFSKDQTLAGDNVSLVKLGNELHAPQDEMNIERKNVTFWENLKDDGKVVKAIQAYEKANKK